VALAPLQELGGIGRHVTPEHVGAVELAQELNDLVLGRGVVAEAGASRLPNRLDGAFAVHEADEEIGGRREAVKALGGAVLQDVPGLSPVLVPVDLCVRTEPGLEPRHPVPRRAEERPGHALHINDQ